MASEGRPTMKVGLFINTQFPEGFNVAERVPEMVELAGGMKKVFAFGVRPSPFPASWGPPRLRSSVPQMPESLAKSP